MQINMIQFILSESEKIVIELNDPLETLYYCDRISTFFVKDDVRYLLSVDSLYDDIYVFRALLDKALNNQLHLHPSIQKDIGYLFNQDMEDKPGLTYTKLEGRDYWVGDNYLVWGCEFAAWLYNEQNTNDIILQITPLYPGDHVPEKETSSVIPYDEWIKQYKSLFIMKIPRDTAYQWRKQADTIVRQIEHNGRTKAPVECTDRG